MVPGTRFIATNRAHGSNIEIVFRFIQPGFEHLPANPMYDLITDIAGHSVMSTVARKTLEIEGYVLPNEAP